MSRRTRWLAINVVIAAGLSSVACSSSATLSTGTVMPPAAEPATSPPLTARPAGAVVPIGPGAEGVDFDPTTGIVAVGRAGGAVLSDESGHILVSVNTPAGPRHVGLSGPGGPFIVPAEGAGQIALVSEPSGQVSALIRTGVMPHDMAVVDNRIFVGNEHSNTATVISQGRVIATIPVARQPGGLASVGHDVAVVGVRSRRLELINAQTLRPIASVPVETGPSHVAAAGHHLYVVDTGGTSVRVFDTTPRLHQVGSVTVPASPLGVAVDTSRERMWVTCTATNRLVDLSLTGNLPHIVASFSTVRQPNSVAVDPDTGTVFVVGEQAGVLQIVHPNLARHS